VPQHKKFQEYFYAAKLPFRKLDMSFNQGCSVKNALKTASHFQQQLNLIFKSV